MRKIVVYSGRSDPVSHNTDDAPVERLAQHPELGGLFAMACGQDVPAAFPRFFTIEDWLRGRTTDQVERDERGR